MPAFRVWSIELARGLGFEPSSLSVLETNAGSLSPPLILSTYRVLSGLYGL